MGRSAHLPEGKTLIGQVGVINVPAAELQTDCEGVPLRFEMESNPVFFFQRNVDLLLNIMRTFL